MGGNINFLQILKVRKIKKLLSMQRVNITLICIAVSCIRQPPFITPAFIYEGKDSHRLRTYYVAALFNHFQYISILWGCILYKGALYIHKCFFVPNRVY